MKSNCNAGKRPRARAGMTAAVLGLLLMSAAHGLGAAPAQEQAAPGSTESVGSGPPRVIATTAWTAAFVQLAGVDEVRVLAPYDMRHPPEYELKPSDIEAVAGARLIVFAGYETMVEKLKDTAGRGDVETLQIDTRNDLATIRPSVRRIAATLGTEEAAEENLAALEAYFAAWRREIAEMGLDGAPALVHFFQQPLARELGFEVRGVFGPGPLEPGQIVELSGHEAALIIDNWHNPISRPLVETVPGAVTVTWINFPGAFETRSLRDVLDYDRRALREARERQER